jgi:hypothetical protein
MMHLDHMEMIVHLKGIRAGDHEMMKLSDRIEMAVALAMNRGR